MVQSDRYNNNKIVVKKSKRASSSASDLLISEKGAMTLEASLIIPIFLIVLLMLTSVGEILMIHQQISHGVCEAAKKAAVNEYRIRQKNAGSGLEGFSTKAAFLASVNRQFLDHSALFGGSKGAAASCKLTMTSKGEYIVSVHYYIYKKMPFLSAFHTSFKQQARQKTMTGYVPDGDELKEGYVYITPHEAVYHTNLSCTHLALDISVDEDVEKYKNEQTHYKACDKCTKYHKGSISCVYVAKEGEAYHTDLSCSGLKRTVKQVDLSTLKGMKPCQRCAKQAGI